MPIVKDGQNVVQETAPAFLDEALGTGCLQTSQFAFADKDRLKQIKFDASSQTTNTNLTLKSGAIASSVTITFPATTGTLALDSAVATNAFTTIQTPSGTSPVADSPTDTLTLATDGSVGIVGNATTDTITFSANPAPVAIASTTVDCSLGNTFTKTLSGTTTLTFSNFPDSGEIFIYLNNNGTARTVTLTGVIYALGQGVTSSSGKDLYVVKKIGSDLIGNMTPGVA